MPVNRRFPVRLLLVEDRAADAELLLATLTSGGFVCTWTRVQTGEALRGALGEPLDAVIADYSLPGFTGLDALKIVRELHPDLPFILVSGTVGEDQAVGAIKLGADDYLLKDRLIRLPTALDHALRHRRLSIEARRAQLDVEAQSRLLRSVIDSMADGVLVANRRGELELVNSAARRIMGDVLLAARPGDWTSEQGLIDATANIPLTAEDSPLLRAVRGFSTDAKEILVKRPGMETCIVSASGRPIVDAAGMPCGGVSTWRDVSIERRAQEALRLNEVRYRDLFWNDIVGHYVSTPAGRLLACNPAFAEIFGFASVENALRTDLAQIYQRPEDRARFLDLMTREKVLKHFEQVNVRQDGRVIHIIENTIGVFDDHGGLVEIQGSIIDITAQRESEERLKYAQILDVVGELAAGVALDVNNLLTVILGHAEQLLEEAPISDACRMHLGEIVGAVQRGSGSTRQLLMFARQQVMNPQVLDVNDAIHSIEPMLRQLVGMRVTLETDLAAGAPLVRADPGRLDQVITCLVANAREAMPSGGTLRIQTGVTTRDSDRGQENLPGLGLTFVFLTVSDTGAGMDEATRARIFEPSITTKGPGSRRGIGVGLAVVRNIVEQIGGSISVESTPGAGTLFRILFPDAQQGARAPLLKQVVQQKPHAPAHETVLLADDDDGVRRFVRSALAAHGYRVLEAADGAEAIKILQAPSPVALVIADIVMLQMGGVALGTVVTRDYPNTRLMYMSGRPHGWEGAGPSNTPFLAKPFSLIDLLRKVRETLDAPH